ncbi:hypothetical protein EC957_002962 [Mortierella hygrophila]|uniref:Uncharacterized protein n=1 Tax=Mortierella hygrophila TaxID=979708 RepID=A0A9P6K1F4_9FUNG|nr:hypothetical protein EC957_002962 [Mortierella hygrophila]
MECFIADRLRQDSDLAITAQAPLQHYRPSNVDVMGCPSIKPATPIEFFTKPTKSDTKLMKFIQGFSKNVHLDQYKAPKAPYIVFNKLTLNRKHDARVHEFQERCTELIRPVDYATFRPRDLQYSSVLNPTSIPPMPCLTRYRGFFCSSSQVPECTFRLKYSHKTNVSHLHHMLWLLRLSSATLTHLCLLQSPLFSVDLIRDVYRPLHHLKSIELPLVESLGECSAPFLYSIFQHCPALEKLTLPSLGDHAAVQDVPQVIGDCCPGITDLTIPLPMDFNSKMCTSIMERIQASD